MREQVDRFIDQGKQSLQSGQVHEALDLLEQAVALEPTNSEAHGLVGVALAQLQRPAEASASFLRAVDLNPASSKAHFNLAVHLYAQGARDAALQSVREAVRLEPSNGGALELLGQLEPASKALTSTSELPIPLGPPPIASYAYRSGYVAPIHSMQFVERLGSTWTIFGWIIVVVGFGGFVLGLVSGADMIRGLIENEGNFDSLSDMIAGQTSPTGIIANLLSALMIIAGWVWVLIDIIDRRANWVWIVPLVMCCIFQMHWLALAIYMLSGRKAS